MQQCNTVFFTYLNRLSNHTHELFNIKVCNIIISIKNRSKVLVKRFILKMNHEFIIYDLSQLNVLALGQKAMLS